jgi:hypothetical protein
LDYVGPPLNDVFKCPTCGDILAHELLTPFHNCRTLRAPTPLYFFGQKAVYTDYTYRTVLRTYNLHFNWFMTALELADHSVEAVRDCEFRVRAALDRIRAGNIRPHSVTPLVVQLNRAVKAREAWENVRSFLQSKKVFLDWFYNFDTPLPEPILHDDTEYYDKNMEKLFYLQMRWNARDLQRNIQLGHLDI